MKALRALALVIVTTAALLAPPAAADPAVDLVPAAVFALSDGESSRIVVLEADGTTRALSSGPQDAAPVSAPDGARAAFVRLAAADEPQGELGLVDLDTGDVELTGITVDRTSPLLWEDDDALIATTPDGIVRIRPEFRFVEFVPGTAAGQVALDVRSQPPGILAASPPVVEERPLRLLELAGGSAPTVLWSASEIRYALPAASYGPAGTIAFVTTISSIGFGTQQYVHFLDAEGDEIQDAVYGGDGPVNLRSGPFWQPDGGAVLFGGTGTQRFPAQETAPATLLVEAPGTAGDQTLATRPKPNVLQALGWRPDGSAAVAVSDAPDSDAALLLVDRDGQVLREVALPGDLSATEFGAPNADLLPPIRRVAGSTRTATAVQVSQRSFPSSADEAGPLAGHVVLARSDVYADALAGAPLARFLEAPLLLTGSAGLDEATAAEIRRLDAGEAVLLGGEAALGAQVVADLQQLGLQVRRVAGPDRFATAAAVAAELPASDRVVLVQGADPDPGRGWPDAVTAGPLAAATATPLLLTTTEELPEATAQALRDRSPATVTVVGGPSAVSEAVATAGADAAGGNVQRIAGPTRVGTSVAVAETQIAAGTGSAASLWVATAADWPDALAAGPAVAADGGVLLLAPDPPVDSALTGFLARTDSRVARLVGGPGVLGGAELHHLLLSAGLGGPDARPLDVG